MGGGQFLMGKVPMYLTLDGWWADRNPGGPLSSFGFRVSSFGCSFRVTGFDFRVSGFGFRVSSFLFSGGTVQAGPNPHFLCAMLLHGLLCLPPMSVP